MNIVSHKLPTEDKLFAIIMDTSTTVWENDLVKKNIEKWLSNFKGDILSLKEERILALWLLNHFTFYNESEVRHLCRVIYNDLIHEIVKESSNANFEELIDLFFKKTNIISSGKTSDSGGFISYFFRQETSLPYKLFNFSIHNISGKIENLLIIDDVTLTVGEKSQAYRFFKNAVKVHPQKKFFLLTLVANEKSIKVLANDFDVKVISAIILDERDKCFNEKSYIFNAFPELIEISKNFAKHYGEKIIKEIPLGYMNGQYAFGFFYNTPNNSLPIFWGKINNWIPIIKRYHKNYKLEKYLADERFI